jgi:hypothetical protein
MTVAAGDAHDRPIYAARYRVVFPLLDADGDLVTGATTPDSERSIDQGTFADCTNEMTEIATNSGVYYLDLTATEMTCSCLAIIAKSATAGMKTTVLTLYPVRMPILRSGTAQAGAGSTMTLDSGASAKDGAYVGMYLQCSNNSPSNVQGQTRKIVSYVGSTKVATVDAAWGTNPSSATTFDILVPETVNIQAFMGKEFVDWGTAGTPKVDVVSLAASSITASVIATDAIDDDAIATGAIASTAFAAGAINAAAIASDALTPAKIKAVGIGTATSGGSTTSVPTSAFSPAGAIADQFKNRTLLFDDDTATTTLRGCARQITASSNAATPTFTVDALPAAPASGDTFSVI